MIAEIRLKLDDDSRQRLDAFVEQLAARTKNIDGALKNTGEALLQTTRDRFETGTDPQGRKWKPLSALTVRLRGASSPVLWNTGRLRGSISWSISGGRLELGPNTVDAAVHQFGATIVPREKKALRIPAGRGGAVFAGKVKIPARPYIGFGPKDEQAAMDALEDWLDVLQS